ncbi:Ig-like domain-containing protein [Anaerocolumna sp. AGMB13025]|uniref:Ig-like domain-containing protein n=1 Tax=Anaerocolumna sp. AGMB13025 TaxID=3039116 RepID=UPI003FA4C92E
MTNYLGTYRNYCNTSTISECCVYKISKNNLILYVGDTYSIKVTGTTKTVKWVSNNSSVASVTSKGKITANDIGKTIIIGKVGSKNYSCKIEVRSNKFTDRLSEIDNFIIGTIWNNAFCNIDWYISSGTDSVGGN